MTNSRENLRVETADVSLEDHHEVFDFKHREEDEARAEVSGLNKILGGLGVDNMLGTEGADQMRGMAGDDHFAALGGADRILGGSGYDVLAGGGGQDRIHGGADGDYIIGEGGIDRLIGGSGRDQFVYQGFIREHESGPKPGERDVIVDFNRGEDRLTFAELPLNGGKGGYQFIGTSEFTGAGQIRYVATDHGDLKVLVNMDDDRAPELGIHLNNVTKLGVDDFFL